MKGVTVGEDGQPVFPEITDDPMDMEMMGLDDAVCPKCKAAQDAAPRGEAKARYDPYNIERYETVDVKLRRQKLMNAYRKRKTRR